MPKPRSVPKSEPADWEDDETRATTSPGDHDFARPSIWPALTVLAHPDASRVGERLILLPLVAGGEVFLSRIDAAFRAPQTSGLREATAFSDARPLGELSLSRRPVCFRAAASGAIVIDRTATRTKVEAFGEPITEKRIFSAEEVSRGVPLLFARKIALCLHDVLVSDEDPPPSGGLVGESTQIVRLRREIRRLAPLDVPVLLRGETGTGKELAARALHTASPRREGPYVVVNMGTLNPSLAASELFGAERGAYTGAERKKEGYFQSAQGGTLFLDEIGEAPPEVQVMLLRALENGEIVPVGGVKPLKTNVRVVAATDARLEEAIAEGRFRAPLYHRLAGYALYLPALRERMDDLGRLFFHFLEEELAKLGEPKLGSEGEGPWPPSALIARLACYDWPGNVRELRNAARRLAINGRENPFVFPDPVIPDPVISSPWPAPIPSRDEPPPSLGPPKRRKLRKPEDVAPDELLAALREHRWHLRNAAEALGVSRGNLYRMMDDHPEIRTVKELSTEEIEAATAAANGDLEEAALELKVSLHGLKRRVKAL